MGRESFHRSLFQGSLRTGKEEKMATDDLPSELLAEAQELAGGADDIIPSGVEGLARKLLQARSEGRPLRVKLGVDPTSAHLHLGHAAVFRVLRRFQDRGHQVVILIGGFTARIGDPTGRNATRPPLTVEEVTRNAETFLNQLRRIVDVDAVEVVNNASWFDQMSMPEIMALAGKVTVNQLLAKDDFKTRIGGGNSVALHEFIYPVLQGLDSVKVRADIELGGTDQRFNLLMGRQLQPAFGQEPQAALMIPILEGIDGKRKMSKTFGNAIALDDSADDVVTKVMRIPDELILKFCTLGTSMSAEEVERERVFLADESNNKMEAKKRLAHRIAEELHDTAAADAALAGWEKVHSKRELPDVMPERKLEAPVGLVKLLVESGMAESNTKARRLITDGAVKLDGEKVVDVDRQLELASGGTLVVQVGRKKFLKLVA